MDIKLIAMDLDGTLTNEKKEITPLTLQALMKVQDKGIRLVLASGRPPYGMRPLAHQLKMEDYGGIIQSYNGGHVETCEVKAPEAGSSSRVATSLIERWQNKSRGKAESGKLKELTTQDSSLTTQDSSLTTQKVLVEQALDVSLLPKLKGFQEESGHDADGHPSMTLMTYYEDTIYTEQPDNKYVNISAFNNKMKVQGVADFVSDTPRPLNKCLMVGDPEIVPYWEKKMQQEMEGKMHILRSTPYFIELLPIGIDKGPSLIKMLPLLGLKPEQMMTFGDSYNDIMMLKLAGIGVAMGNAEEKVKSVADYITDDNDHDGIAKALEHFGLI